VNFDGKDYVEGFNQTKIDKITKYGWKIVNLPGHLIRKEGVKMGVQEDLDAYVKGMMDNNVDRCLMIEQQYGLAGYPPNIVGNALQLMAAGCTFVEAMENLGL